MAVAFAAAQTAQAAASQAATDAAASASQVSGLSSTVSGHTTQINGLTSGKADKTSLATVALTGKWVDLVGAPPVATVVATASSAARPTSDPSVRVIFYTPTPPVAVMLAGDVWEPTV